MRRFWGGRSAAVKRLALVAVVLYALAAGSVIQARGWTQTSHYALVRALSEGTAIIDPWHEETGDKAWTSGHFYSVKAPGLAFLVLPVYLVLRALSAIPDELRAAIWQMTLFGAVLPGTALLLLMRRETDRVIAGTGLAAAGALALGTLLPFSTLLFGHVLAAMLAFAAFALLVQERRAGGSWRLAAGAGLLAGAAVLVEYPSGLAMLVLAGFVLTRPDRLSRGAAYAAGVAVPLAILAGYNRWAFGSFTHLSYDNSVIVPGRTGHDVIGATSDGFFGVTAPSLRVAVDLLLSSRGFLAVTPVVGVALAGLVLLYRSGRRAEALVPAAMFVAYLVYNAGIKTTFGGPFGGDSPGPRYMVVAMPFLVAGVAVAIRRAPGSAVVLVGASVVSMVVGTATKPLLELDEGLGTWFDLARAGEFTATVLTPLGAGSGWLAILPFLVLAALAALVPWRRPPALSTHVVVAAAVAFGAWIVVAVTAPPMLDPRGSASWLTTAGVVALAAAAVAVVVVTERRAYAAGLALLPLAGARLAFEHSEWVVALSVAALLVAAAAYAAEATRMRPSASEGRRRYNGRTAER
jgi:hypothetical protein